MRPAIKPSERIKTQKLIASRNRAKAQEDQETHEWAEKLAGEFWEKYNKSSPSLARRIVVACGRFK